MSAKLDDAINASPETVVGPSVKIQGDLNSEGNIRIEGQVQGKVKTSQSVLVGNGAKIVADIMAMSVVWWTMITTFLLAKNQHVINNLVVKK
jgi:cytoskeletal protein CcmA (bactofilin family)